MIKNNFLNFYISLFILFLTSSWAQNKFVLNSGTQFVTTGNVTIDYKGGTFTNSGTLTNTNGTIVFSAPVTFDGSGTTTTKDLKVAHTGTSQLNNRINVTGTLFVNNGNLNANDKLTLVSNSSGSAVIAPVTLGSTINGKVTVQRYIAQGKRAFRFLSPSVTTDDYISNNWQLTTHITGSTSGANGFDATVSGNPSLFKYNNQQTSGSGWSAIANTNATNLQTSQGYRLLVRGDRTPTNITNVSLDNMNTAITLSATGTVVTGDVTFNSSSNPSINATTNTTTDGFSLVGNPYVNTLNWNTLTKTGLSDAYYIWDSNMGTTAQRGRYVAYSTLTGSSNIASAANEYIQPGQAFFVKNSTLGIAGSLLFKESDKAGISNVNNYYRTTNSLFTRIDVHVFEANELVLGGNPIDATVAVFDNQFTPAVETGDVTKLSTGAENISFLNTGTALAIDARPVIAITDELQINMQQFIANKNYVFKTTFSNFDASVTPYLVDSFLNHTTSLVNNSDTNVSFSTTNDPASFNSNRFKIVFQNTTLSNPSFEASAIRLFPNPITESQFNITLPNSLTGDVTVKVINLLGQTVYETTTKVRNTITIKTTHPLEQAMYMVQIENQGKTITKKIVIN